MGGIPKRFKSVVQFRTTVTGAGAVSSTSTLTGKRRPSAEPSWRESPVIESGRVSKSGSGTPASAGFYSVSASSSAARSSAGLTRPLCLKTSAPERS